MCKSVSIPDLLDLALAVPLAVGASLLSVWVLKQFAGRAGR